jgi:hypothetical protein
MLSPLCLFVGLALAEDPGATEVPAVWTLAMPLGVPQFTHGEKTRGLQFGGVQAVGIGATVYSQMKMLELAQSDDPGGREELGWRRASVAGSAVTGLAWLASVIDGSRLHDAALEGAAMAESARAWDGVVTSE